MNEKCRRFSLVSKILFFIMITFLVSVVFLSGSLYSQIQKSIIDGLSEKSTIAAEFSAEMLKGFDFNKENLNDVSKDILRKNINEVRQLAGAEFMYSLYEENGKVYYGIEGSEDPEEFGTLYDESYEYLKNVFEKGEILVSEEIEKTEEYGALFMVYTPIYNDKGDIQGVLGIDFDANYAQNKIDTAAKMVAILLPIFLLIVDILIYLILRPTKKALKNINSKIAELANAEGDLTQTIEIHSGDELELISNNVNKMLSNLAEIIGAVKVNSNEVSNLSDDIENKTSKQVEDVSSIASIMEEIGAGMEESSASLEQINDSVSNTSKDIEVLVDEVEVCNTKTDDIKKKASNMYDETSETIKEVNSKIDILSNEMKEKIEKSKAVQEINALTKSIIDMASQTKLLSLNASIEAARAGEAGRGFSVVAEEVGKLSLESSNTAKRIQEVSNNVIEAVEELSTKSEEMIDFLNNYTKKGYNSLQMISEENKENMEEIHNYFVSILAKFKEIEKTMESVRDNSSAINIAVEESAKGVSETVNLATDLTVNSEQILNIAKESVQKTDELIELVDKFKTN